MNQLLISVPEEIVARLRRRAERTGRSLEAEALDVLEHAEMPLPPLRHNDPFSVALSRRLAEVGMTQDDWEALARSLEAVRGSRGDSIHRWIDFSDWPDDP